MTSHTEPGPLAPNQERIQSLDVIRGVAVFGILVMNAVSFGLPLEAYFDLRAGGFNSLSDQFIGITGEVLVARKAMGLFSLLFGAGVVLFAARAAAKGRRSVRLSLWRNVLLLGIGIAHAWLWEGDVLIVYALCSPIVLALRNLPVRVLLLGGLLACWSPAIVGGLASVTVSGATFQSMSLSDYEAWFELWFVADVFARAFGMMLCGAALFRADVFNDSTASPWPERLALIGLPIGLALCGLGVSLQLNSDDSLRDTLLSESAGVIGTPLVVAGYISILLVWARRPATWFKSRVAAVGRMALTNYLTQTLLGVFVLGAIAEHVTMSRTLVFGFVVSVWFAQFAWSKPWLTYFRFGPAEWLWRSATYLSWMPFRQAAATTAPASAPAE